MTTESREGSLIIVAGSDKTPLNARAIAHPWRNDGYKTVVIEPDWGKNENDIVEQVSSAVGTELKLGQGVLVFGLEDGGLPTFVGTQQYRGSVMLATAGTKFDDSSTSATSSPQVALRRHIKEGLSAGTLSVQPDRVLNIIGPSDELEGLVLPRASVYRARSRIKWSDPLTDALVYQRRIVREIFREESFRNSVMPATYR